MKRLTPRMASEISGRLTAVDPAIRKVFAMDEVSISGGELETLACAIWLIGYGEALADILELPGTPPNVQPLMEAWGIEL